MPECSCGKFYSTPEGVALCQHNGHGSGKDAYGDKFLFKHTLEPELTIVCAECGTPLRGYLRTSGMNVEMNVLPHVCQINAPE
jgi:hypothetical protein